MDNKMNRIGLLPAAGLATRLGIKTPKELIKVEGITIIDYSVHNLIDAGLTNIVVVIRKGKEDIKTHLDKTFKDINFIYVYQDGVIGNLLDAVKSSYKEIQGKEVFFCMPDTRVAPNPFINIDKDYGELFLGCHHTEKPKDLNTVLDNGYVIEKPKNPTTDIAWGILVWNEIFTERLMHYDDLTSAINDAIFKKWKIVIDYYEDIGVKK